MREAILYSENGQEVKITVSDKLGLGKLVDENIGQRLPFLKGAICVCVYFMGKFYDKKRPSGAQAREVLVLCRKWPWPEKGFTPLEMARYYDEDRYKLNRRFSDLAKNNLIQRTSEKREKCGVYKLAGVL
jgi:hypothetical protein